MPTKNIVFYFPYNQGAGGVNVLFLRLAKWLADNTDRGVYLVDYPDGYMITHNDNPMITALPLVAGEPLALPEDATIVLQTMPVWHLPRELEIPRQTRFLFWNLHPYNLLWDFSIERNRGSLRMRLRTWVPYVYLRKFVTVLLRHRGIAFMDGENASKSETITCLSITDPVFLPICAGYLDRHAIPAGRDFAWVGRLCDFKVTILTYTMRRLAAYAAEREKPIRFHVIGDGPDRDQVERTARDIEGPCFQTIFAGEMHPVAMNGYLTERVNLLFAMGASALEGARLGLPVVLLDFSFEPISGDYIYRFIQQTEQYNMGRDIDARCFEPGNRSLESMLDDLETNHAARSDETFVYYRENHSLQTIGERLLTILDACDLSYRELETLRDSVVLRLHARFWALASRVYRALPGVRSK